MKVIKNAKFNAVEVKKRMKLINSKLESMV